MEAKNGSGEGWIGASSRFSNFLAGYIHNL